MLKNYMKIKLLLLIGFICSILPLSAQKAGAFNKLGREEKLWVILHPFSAGEAYEISMHVEDLSNKMKDSAKLDADLSGGKLDAFRHAYWMALLTKHIGPKRARWLGNAHERKNRRDFENNRTEEGFVPDKVSVMMDLFNNEVGIQIGKDFKDFSDEALKEKVLQYIEKGNMLVVKKDRKANSLDAAGELIPNENWEGKWENDRVLVPSDYQP